MATILVVDDDDDVRDMPSDALKEAGYTAIVAPNGDAGLQKVIDERDQPRSDRHHHAATRRDRNHHENPLDTSGCAHSAAITGPCCARFNGIWSAKLAKPSVWPCPLLKIADRNIVMFDTHLAGAPSGP